MTLPSTAHSAWPSRLAYAAALIFTGASGALNISYGIAKGGDLSAKIVWGSVAAAVAVVFALSWPAVIASLDRQQWSRAGMAFLALLLTGTYSVSAAIGSAMGGRTNAALEEKDTTDKRAKAKASYEGAKAELDGLKPARSVAELEPILEAARPQCRVVATGNKRDTVCTKPPSLTAELGRAKRRAQLEATMEKANRDLAKTGSAKVANSDAVALARYASDLGWAVDADYVNKLLVLLAVLVIECGGGLSLAVGMALSGPSERVLNAEKFGRRQDGRVPDDQGKNALVNVSSAAAPGRSPTLNESLQLAPDVHDKSAAFVRLLSFLTDRGGVLASSQLQLARSLGWSKTWTHETLHALASSGLVKLTTGRTGTVVQLAARPS